MTDVDPVHTTAPEPAPVPAATPPRRSRATVVLASVAVVFFLVAAAFGTLWLIERGDHKDTSGQLNGVRTEAEAGKAKAAGLEGQLKELNDKWQAALSEKQKLENKAKLDVPCADAGREMLNAIKANNEKAGETAGMNIALHCGPA